MDLPKQKKPSRGELLGVIARQKSDIKVKDAAIGQLQQQVLDQGARIQELETQLRVAQTSIVAPG